MIDDVDAEFLVLLTKEFQEAEERGRVEMQEKCANLLEEYSDLEMPPQYSHKQHCIDFVEGWKSSARRMALEIRALLTASPTDQQSP